MIAGKMTTSNVLGYVAAFPIPEVLQGINAFIRGARSVNQGRGAGDLGELLVRPGQEREATTTLLSQGADVVTHHTDSTAVVQAAEEKGGYAFGYHSDMSKYGPRPTSPPPPTSGVVSTRTAQSVLDGSWKPGSVWGGYKRA